MALGFSPEGYSTYVRERFDLIRRIALWDDICVMHLSLQDHNLDDCNINADIRIAEQELAKGIGNPAVQRAGIAIGEELLTLDEWDREEVVELSIPVCQDLVYGRPMNFETALIFLKGGIAIRWASWDADWVLHPTAGHDRSMIGALYFGTELYEPGWNSNMDWTDEVFAADWRLVVGKANG